MEVNALTWGITIAVVIGFFIFDFYTHVKTPHEPTIKESATWSVFYIVLALIFGAFLWVAWPAEGDPHKNGIDFITGYVTEKALSVDNLFIFALIMTSFKIPRKYQQKVLLIGIAMALIFRGIFIALGAAVISAWSDVFYLFGVFLLWTAAKLIIDEVREGEEENDPQNMFIVKLVRKIIPVSTEYHSDRLWFRENKKLWVTPLFIALISIGFIDILFALDSIPAIYGITSEPYIVFTANALALMGLRQLYFLLDGLLDRLVYLSYGLSVILAFIGMKLILHALHENNLPFINGGEGLHVAEISSPVSLMVIAGVLIVTTVLSLTVGKKHLEDSDTDAERRAEEPTETHAR